MIASEDATDRMPLRLFCIMATGITEVTKITTNCHYIAPAIVYAWRRR